VVYLFSQCAGCHAGWNHCGTPGPVKPSGARLEPHLRRRGGSPTAAAGRRAGTDRLIIGDPVPVKRFGYNTNNNLLAGYRYKLRYGTKKVRVQY